VASEGEQHAVAGDKEYADASGQGASNAVDWNQPLKTDTIFKYWAPGRDPDDHETDHGPPGTKPAEK